MIISAYDTTRCKAYRLDSLMKELKKHFIDNSMLSEAKEPDGLPWEMRAVYGSVDSIPQFAHPIILQGSTEFEERTLYVFDARSMTRLDKTTNAYLITARDEYEFQRLRTALTWYADKHGIEDLGALSGFPLLFFSTWVSEAVARSFGLDPRVQMNVSIISAVYFLMLFRASTEPLSEKEKLRYTGLINRHLKYPPQDVADLIDRLPVMVNINDFTNAVVEHSDSIRLERFNVPLLFTMLGGSWYGSSVNAKEIIAVALEHIPTLYAIVFAASSSRAYKKTTISKLIERLNRQGGANDFVKAILRLPEVNTKG